jgi:hypothetical protein
MISIRADLVIKVSDREKASEQLIAQAEAWEGYFLNYSEQGITFNLANEHVDSFLVFCDSLGLVVQKNYETQDMTFDINQMEASLKAKQKLLDDYYEIMNKSVFGTVLQVERTIVSLIAEIERLTGRIRLMRHKTSMANISVRFQFRDRSAPIADGSSPFSWLNRLNLSEMRYEFENMEH